VRNPNEINPFNRGVAMLGTRLFVGTLDAALLALDARTGALLWEVQIADTMQGFKPDSPPLPIKERSSPVSAGGEFGIRGFIDAYRSGDWNADSGASPRFPAGEFGHDSWRAIRGRPAADGIRCFD